MKIKVETSTETSEFDYVGTWSNGTPLSDNDAAAVIQQRLNLRKISAYGIKQVKVFDLKGHVNTGENLHEGTFYASAV